MCPDYAGVLVTHLGRFRVKVEATTFDRRGVTLVLSLNEDEPPNNWAKQAARQLHTVQVA